MTSVPTTLTVADLDPASTGTVSGADVVMKLGETARYAVSPSAPGTFIVYPQTDAPFGARVLVKVDGVPVYSGTLYSDEEDENMPYRTPVETLVTCNAGAVTRLDPAPAANRCEIVIVNTHPSDRLAIARVAAGAAAPTITVDTAAKTSDRQIIEADAGMPLPERADENVAFYAKPTGTSAIVVRVIQKHTA